MSFLLSSRVSGSSKNTDIFFLGDSIIELVEFPETRYLAYLSQVVYPLMTFIVYTNIRMNRGIKKATPIEARNMQIARPMSSRIVILSEDSELDNASSMPWISTRRN